MTSQLDNMTSSALTGPAFHGNIVTGSEVMTIFVHKGLARNPEITNTAV